MHGLNPADLNPAVLIQAVEITGHSPPAPVLAVPARAVLTIADRRNGDIVRQGVRHIASDRVIVPIFAVTT